MQENLNKKYVKNMVIDILVKDKSYQFTMPKSATIFEVKKQLVKQANDDNLLKNVLQIKNNDQLIDLDENNDLKTIRKDYIKRTVESLIKKGFFTNATTFEEAKKLVVAPYRLKFECI